MVDKKDNYKDIRNLTKSGLDKYGTGSFAEPKLPEPRKGQTEIPFREVWHGSYDVSYDTSTGKKERGQIDISLTANGQLYVSFPCGFKGSSSFYSADVGGRKVHHVDENKHLFPDGVYGWEIFSQIVGELFPEVVGDTSADPIREQVRDLLQGSVAEADKEAARSAFDQVLARRVADRSDGHSFNKSTLISHHSFVLKYHHRDPGRDMIRIGDQAITVKDNRGLIEGSDTITTKKDK